MSESNKRSRGLRSELSAPQGYPVLLSVEYDAHTKNESRLKGLRDAHMLFQQEDVLAVSVGLKGELFPLTKAYLDSKAELL